MLASRFHWRLLIGTIVILMGAAFVAPLWVPLPDLQEDRVLAGPPFWPSRIEDIRAFCKAADAYVGDQFPPRPHLIGVLNRLRMLARVSGSNRVIVGRDGWLFYDDGSHLGAARNDPKISGSDIRRWLLAVAGRTEALRARRIPYLIVSPPTKEVIYPQYGPAWYMGPSPDRPAMRLSQLATDTGAAEVLYLGDPVAAATRSGQKTYSRHDTHWNGYGAYAGYTVIMDRLHAMGSTEGPHPLSDFTPVQLQGGGIQRDLALMLAVSSFVDLDFLVLRDPLRETLIRKTFLGPRQDRAAPHVIDTGEVGKPVLLMIRDSFAEALLPMLLGHFSRIVVVHGQDGFWRPDLVDRFKPDVVILEIIEPGLKLVAGDGPPPSPEAVKRVDDVLIAQGTGGAPMLPELTSIATALRAGLSAATPTANCNLETEKLNPGVNGEATVEVSGWISELTPTITSPEGVVMLAGPGGEFAAPLRVDGERPDVASAYDVPSGAASGFLGTFFVRKLPPGHYAVTAYRRAPTGWIACIGNQGIIVPSERNDGFGSSGVSNLPDAALRPGPTGSDHGGAQ